MMNELIKFTLNGKPEEITIDPSLTLLWVLRDQFGLTGTKYGCGIGYCGACTVILNNEPVRSCMLPVSDAANSRIITIEGLGTLKNLSPLQKAFIDHTAFCCGFCTPGMLITATALLERNPHPTREEIVQAMDHNLCRCGSYINIIEAIESFVNGDQRGIDE